LNRRGLGIPFTRQSLEDGRVEAELREICHSKSLRRATVKGAR
jgi:hypothetical protein